jgi:hypothetical protein
MELNNRPYLVVQAILKRLHQTVQQALLTATQAAQLYQAQRPLILEPQVTPAALLNSPRLLLAALLTPATVVILLLLAAALPIQLYLPLKVQVARQTLAQVDRSSRLNTRLGVI